MNLNRRTDPRKQIALPAHVSFPGCKEPIACTVRDISDDGARLHIKQEMPPVFSLLVAKGGKVARLCKVVWRVGADYGVAFERSRARVARA